MSNNIFNNYENLCKMYSFKDKVLLEALLCRQREQSDVRAGCIEILDIGWLHRDIVKSGSSMCN